ncbi:fimbrial protein [Providencia hangzhouensis]|uniref:fimbrial protein n=1 Tax=Providencia hangzhouensis TaxID=3031799 RepID=UPI002AB5D896|nr:fimbrial protein [Providencia rettgeri]
MLILKKINAFTILFLFLLSFQSVAAVNNCVPSSGATSIEQELTFDITNSSASIPNGSLLASADAAMSVMCEFTGSSSAANAVYFKNTMPTAIKTLLINSGVKVVQVNAVSDPDPVTITDPTVPNIYLGSWNGGIINIALWYNFYVYKGANALKPFDTGLFLLGTHVDYLGRDLGGPVYVRIKGDLTLLCPTPAVNITASNGGSVNFGTISPKQMNAGEVVSRTFNLGMSVPQDCETGLNISVRFEPNNNTVLGGKYLDMGNGLQTLLTRNSTDISYDEDYNIGEVMPQSPINVPFTATLSKIAGSTIASGPFSKTVRVVVSY